MSVEFPSPALPHPPVTHGAGDTVAPGTASPPAIPGATTFSGGPVAAIEAIMAERGNHLAYGHTPQQDVANRRPGDLARLAADRLRGAIDHAQLGTHEQAVKLLTRAAAFIIAEMDALEARRIQREG